MKKILFIGMAFLPLFFSSCKGGGEAEIAAANQRADSLQAIVDAKDGEIDALFDVLNEIETSLTDISARYGTVASLRRNNPEMNGRVKGQINDQLAIIDKMLSENKDKIAKLNTKISSLGKENSKLQEFIESLNARIAQQESQIDALLNELNISKATIKKLSADVTDLTQANQEKDEYIAYQTNESNKAYYIVGTYKQLKDLGIVNKSGGFIGIGKRQNTTSDMDVSHFTMIDRTQTTVIPINQRKVEFITKHPEDSYELVYDENDKKMVIQLVIKDIKSFWKYSDYLVISTKR